MTREEHLRGDLGARLLLYFEQGDPRGVLAAQALANAEEFLRLGAGPERDYNLAFKVGWLHWARYLTIEPGSEDRELELADGYFEIMHRTQPEGVPDPLRPYYARPPRERGANREATYQRARALIDLAGSSEPACANAVSFLREAAADTPRDHQHRALYLNELGNLLAARFERTGRPADIDAAVAALREGLAEIAPDHPHSGLLLVNLGGSLRIRFESSGAATDLAESVRASEEAVAAIPRGNERRAGAVSTLGAILRRRYEQSGSLPDLDRAIELDAEAVAATPRTDPRHRNYLSNLAVAFRSRYEATGELVDLDSALSHGVEALRGVPPSDPDFPRYASNLSVALFRRFLHLEEDDELEQAAELGRVALDRTPPVSPHRFARLSCLADVLLARGRHRGDGGDLEQAVGLYRQVGELLPPGHPDRIANSATICAALLLRAERSNDPDDLEAAVEAGRRAAAEAPPDHPGRGGAMSNLAAALAARAKPGDPSDAARAYEEAAAASSSPPGQRALAARERARLAGEEGDWPAAVEAYATALGLLSRVAGRKLSRNSRQAQLGVLSGLAAAAAAACLEAGEPERAVELWEQGRGVLIAQALESRGDLGELSRAHPLLADRFLELNRVLDGTGSGEASQRTLAPQRDAAAKLEDLVRTVRELPGFERFLRPPPIADLLATASEGPVVAINVDPRRSDALVLSTQGVEVVPLPALTAERTAANVGKYLLALEDRAERPLKEVLTWLWESLCEPVFTALGLAANEDVPARIWWCPGGLLGFLPLHAAGRFPVGGVEGSDSALDRAVSSYIPTLGALAHARRAPGEAPAPSPTVLGVAMSSTPGATALPGAEREAALLEERFGRRVELLRDGEARHAAVLAGLKRHPWAHFACHGHAQIPDPSAGSLLLTDHREQPLTVADLGRLRLEHAELAYLSACSTARTHPFIPDEAIHLGSAFLIAGYRQVIATLWEIDDDVAVDLAARLYEGIGDEGAERAAARLREATLALRRRHPGSPSLWASHIHCGV